MSDQSSYETLGVTEASSFEEIQTARDRLLEACSDDRKEMEAIEAAYDAILMERLRLRQEGKIKVPDRIRFAEKSPEPALDAPPAVSRPNAAWLNQLLDTPERKDILQPAGIFCLLALAGFYSPALALALGVACSVYFLNRKEHKLWRSVLLTLLGLVIGLALGLTAGQLLIPQGAEFEFASPEAVAALVTFLVLWLASSFLR
ncbi:CPP1-like family protein [Almyronema epifaneia]|uniref:CPP1-like family protein n=1 Tax=Almyronema epifaneia S1 TaxID=2991925 RepID=A0ABW6IC18_9CYAN